MFSIMNEYHKKFNNLNKLKTQTKDNEKRKQKVLTNVGDVEEQKKQEEQKPIKSCYKTLIKQITDEEKI